MRKTLLVGLPALALLAGAILAHRPTALPVAAKRTLARAERPEPTFDHPTPSIAPAPRPIEKDLSPADSQTLHDATLLELIQNAKVAARQGQPAIRSAMLAGLRKERGRARELLASARAQAADGEDYAALDGLLRELR